MAFSTAVLAGPYDDGIPKNFNNIQDGIHQKGPGHAGVTTTDHKINACAAAFDSCFPQNQFQKINSPREQTLN